MPNMPSFDEDLDRMAHALGLSRRSFSDAEAVSARTAYAFGTRDALLIVLREVIRLRGDLTAVQARLARLELLVRQENYADLEAEASRLESQHL
jgi:hypothetical protein